MENKNMVSVKETVTLACQRHIFTKCYHEWTELPVWFCSFSEECCIVYHWSFLTERLQNFLTNSGWDLLLIQLPYWFFFIPIIEACALKIIKVLDTKTSDIYQLTPIHNCLKWEYWRKPNPVIPVTMKCQLCSPCRTTLFLSFSANLNVCVFVGSCSCSEVYSSASFSIQQK